MNTSGDIIHPMTPVLKGKTYYYADPPATFTLKNLDNSNSTTADIVSSNGVNMEEYRELENDSRMLYALIEAGVEEWEGYNTALAIYREREDQ